MVKASGGYAAAADDRHSKDPKSSVSATHASKKKGALNGDVKWMARDASDKQKLDPGDPNYDSEAEDADDYVLQETPIEPKPTKEKKNDKPSVGRHLSRGSSFGEESELQSELPSHWTLSEFQEKVKLPIAECLVTQETEEAIDRLQLVLKDCPFSDELVVTAVRKAFEVTPEKQPVIPKLLCALHNDGTLNTASLIRGFEKLICTWEDSAIDAPLAPKVLIKTVWHCIEGFAVDEIVLSKLPESLINASLGQLDDEKLKEKLGGVKDKLQQFKKKISHPVKEYFVGLNVMEVQKHLLELAMPEYHHEFVKKVITTSFTGSDNPQQLRDPALDLLCKLFHSGILVKDDLQWGLTRLLGQLDDLILDCPKVVPLCIDFLSAMVVDELLSAPFLRRCCLLRVGGVHGLSVLDGAQRKIPVYWKKQLGTAQFKREVHTMILEYFNSEDCEEVGRLVRELSPMTLEQSAEVVRKLMTFAMERSGKECELALQLLIWLCRHEELDDNAIEQGFNDLYERMEDLLLDVPDAREMSRSFVTEAKKSEILRSTWAEPSPAA